MKYVKYLREIFNTKTYKWIKSDFTYQKLATFEINDKKYFVNIDEVMINVYNIHFYLIQNGEKIYDLIKTNDKTEFRILSNVKKCIEDFIENTEYIEFIGFSSDEKERQDLYMLFLQSLASYGFIYSRKTLNKFEYFFLYKKEIPRMILDTYIDKFIENDNKIKK